MPLWLIGVSIAYRKIAIFGGPGVGKTTMSKLFTDRPVLGTDDYQTMAWEDIPGALIERTSGMGKSFLVEGVQVARALRKGLQVDAVIYLETQRRPDPLPGQLAMAEGIATVFSEWRESPGAARVPVFGEDGRQK